MMLRLSVFLVIFGIAYGLKDCLYSGVNQTSGSRFPSTDGCNNCFCNNGAVACTLKLCLPTTKLTCTYGNTTRHEGESFKSTDGCNTCGCSRGMVFCTEMACLNPIVLPG